jgi:hypothetical protein
MYVINNITVQIHSETGKVLFKITLCSFCEPSEPQYNFLSTSI